MSADFSKIVVGGRSSVTADQMQRFWHQVVNNAITKALFQKFLEHEDPFKSSNAGEKSERLTVKQLSDFWRQVNDASITRDMFEDLLSGRNPFDIAKARRSWEGFYKRHFGLEVDFSHVSVPDDPGGFKLVMFIPKGIKFDQVIEAMRKKFRVFVQFDNLEKEVVENARTTEHSYAIRLRNRRKAEEQLYTGTDDKFTSSNTSNCQTLLERMILELWYFVETAGRHWDDNNVSLCAGSLYSNGNVPMCYTRSTCDGLEFWIQDSIDHRSVGNYLIRRVIS